jgi:hypothetical protein
MPERADAQKQTSPPEHRVARCASSGPVNAAAKNGGPCSARPVSPRLSSGLDYTHPLSGWWGRTFGPKLIRAPCCRHVIPDTNIPGKPGDLSGIPAVPVRRFACGSKPRATSEPPLWLYPTPKLPTPSKSIHSLGPSWHQGAAACGGWKLKTRRSPASTNVRMWSSQSASALRTSHS